LPIGAGVLFPPIAVNNVNSRDHNKSWDPEDAKSSNKSPRAVPTTTAEPTTEAYQAATSAGTPAIADIQYCISSSRDTKNRGAASSFPSQQASNVVFRYKLN
jgi:hypothetical protein